MIRVRPLERWPREETESRGTSKFKASWRDTHEAFVKVQEAGRVLGITK